MIPKLSDYTKVAGKDVIEKIRKSAEPLEDKHLVHINATSSGGGVAEILNTLVFLMNDVGIDTGWRTIVERSPFLRSPRLYIIPCRALGGTLMRRG